MRKLSISKIIFPVAFSVLFLFVSLTLFGCSFEEFIGYIDEQLKFPEYYTNDIADYGNFKDITDENADYFIRSFFPDKIENDFQDVVYSYTVVPYGCEVYLEFTFSTDAKFYDHLDKVAYDKMRQTFYFDTDFYEYICQEEINWNTGRRAKADYIRIDRDDLKNAESEAYTVELAGIRKVLINEAEKRVIYISLFTCDGGTFDTNDLNSYYFSRFNLNWREYNDYAERWL